MKWIKEKAKRFVAVVVIVFVCVIAMTMYLFAKDEDIDDINDYWRWL